MVDRLRNLQAAAQQAMPQPTTIIVLQNQVVDIDRHICTFCCCCKCCHIKYACIFLLIMELLFGALEFLVGYEMATNTSYKPVQVTGIVLMAKQGLVLLAVGGVALALWTLRGCPVVIYIVVHSIYIVIISVVLLVFVLGLTGAFAVPALIDSETGVLSLNKAMHKIDPAGITKGNPIDVAEYGFRAIQAIMGAGIALCVLAIGLHAWVISKFTHLMRYLNEARKAKEMAGLELNRPDQLANQIAATAANGYDDTGVSPLVVA